MMTRKIGEAIEKAVAAIRATEHRMPSLGLILGSGLGGLADAVDDATEFETRAIPGYPPSTVEGHRGRLVIGLLEGKEVAVVQGRVHCYEGLPPSTVTFPVQLLYALGARSLLVTNAAGGANPSFAPGTLMFIDDHINMAFRNPLVGPNDRGGPRFPDMSSPYDQGWINEVEQMTLEEGVPTERGVYLWTLGPSYETKAEVRAFRRLGADAIGMSTVPEVIEANYLGMRVLGISTITNPAAGLGSEPLVHDDVVEVGRAVRGNLERVVRVVLNTL